MTLVAKIQTFSRGGSRNLRKGGRSPSCLLFLSLSPLPPRSFPLEVGPLKPARWSGERCKLPQWGPGQSPGQKRIWCPLKLSESHWWQSFWIFWVPCFTIERSLANMTLSNGVSPSPKGGGGAGSAPSKSRHCSKLDCIIRILGERSHEFLVTNCCID